ncbi:MAG: glycoside hydrolase family 13 protein [Treponema sp.]|nr:glycoside hydrolase family 13 protein [Treponema sp.]
MTNSIPCKKHMWVEHKASLPYCWYDRYKGKITLRLIASEDPESITVIYGDPYDWEKSGGRGYFWRFAEAGMFRALGGTYRGVWKAEIDLPSFMRLKYGFRIKNKAEEWYFSENGLEPYGAEAVNLPHNHFFFFVHDVDAPSAPAWTQDRVWYQIFPDRFCRGNLSVSPPGLEDWETGRPGQGSFFGGGLEGIRKKLPWLENLGINGVYLTPIFTSPSNHKYDTADYFSVDKNFGGLGELKSLIAEAHSRGIRVMLDGVFNHAGKEHPFWRDVLKNQERSVYRDYFHIRRFPVRESNKGRDLDFDAFAFSPIMPKWNTENPGARKYLLDAAAYWIRECDIDGWRLDVANEVSFDFWKEFSRLVRALKNDFYLVGEIWHDPSPWINSGYFDAVMNYPLGLAVSDYFLERKTGAGRFTERIFSVLSRLSDLHNSMAFNLLDSHDTRRALNRAKEDKQALRNAFAMLFLLPGSPCIYYGTETGMTGGDDPDCRRPMIWDEAKQDKELLKFFKDLIGFRKIYYTIINQSVIEYKNMGNLRCWKFSGASESLYAVYAEDKPGKPPEIPGVRVFSTGPAESGELAPYTLAVYYEGSTDKRSFLGGIDR